MCATKHGISNMLFFAFLQNLSKMSLTVNSKFQNFKGQCVLNTVALHYPSIFFLSLFIETRVIIYMTITHICMLFFLLLNTKTATTDIQSYKATTS